MTFLPTVLQEAIGAEFDTLSAFRNSRRPRAAASYGQANRRSGSCRFNPLNIQNPLQVAPGDARYSGYESAKSLFKASLNSSVDPCNDFYQYACGNFNGVMSFGASDMNNAIAMVEQMNDLTYVNSSPVPVKQVTWYYMQCSTARMNWTSTNSNGKYVMDAINRIAAGEQNFVNETQFPFYMLYQDVDVKNFPTRIGMGYLLGYPAGWEDVPTLVTPVVDTNWKDPHGSNGYLYYLDQPTTLLPYTYHVNAWSLYQQSMVDSIVTTMDLLASTQKRLLDQGQLLQDAKDIVAFDHLLALTYSTDDTTRRQFERSYNPMTIKQLSQTYGNISWHTYIPESIGIAQNVQSRLLSDPNYKYIVMEPLKLQMLNDMLGDPKFVSSRTLINYIYYAVVDHNADFLPWSSQESSKSMVRFHSRSRPPFGKPRRIRPEERRFERRQYDELVESQIDCAMETVSTLPYANARVFIDKIYPTAASRAQMRDNVAKIASSILIGFRSMIDQLNWMTSASKSGAYNKIENLVKNIAYPDWITDDAQFTAYHHELGVSVNVDDYFTMVRKAQLFNDYTFWILLLAGPANRIRFIGEPGATNAWYQPEVNSINIPAAILHKPFYDPTWPTAVNFGAMGVVAGHELTHGFDDQGVQWDGTGVLSPWMDNSSKAGFNNMANCVVNEYNGFCPLNKTVYGSASCINGAQTQGENIADNGGIHAAYRAYRNFINLYGPDPQLPDELLQEFTADQLFFLSFAQIWCEEPSPDSRVMRQILGDPHSPSKYRVLGAIQNFPAFKDAFHCTTSAYAPDKHCDVWVSDIDSSYGEPEVKNELNVETNKQITTADFDKYNAYKMAVDYYQYSLNASANPCDDFFEYACGNYDKLVSFHYADANNFVIMAAQLNSPAYQSTINSSTALTKEKAFSDACIAANIDATTTNSTLVSKDYLMARVNRLTNYLGSSFTYSFGGNVAALPNSKQLANALAYLSFTQGIDTLVTPFVDTNWNDPTKGYRMFMDQNTAYMSKTYYSPNAFKTIEDNYINTATNVIGNFTMEQGVPFNKTALRDKVKGLVEFEQMIANNYSTDDGTRRKYARLWNLMSIADLQKNYGFIDWPTYLKWVPDVAQSVVQKSDFMVSVMEKDQYASMTRDYSRLDKEKLVNYLFMRLLLSNTEYLPTYADNFVGMPEESFALGRKRRRSLRSSKQNALSDTQAACAQTANDLMQFANGRVFIDYLYPDDASKKMIRSTAGGLISNVIQSFQGMVEQLDWMTVDTKRKAYNKTMEIIENIAFPDWIMDNKQLDAYYQDLSFNPADNYFDMYSKLIIFNIRLQYKQLTFSQTDRSDFLGQPGAVNAWYQPELNSITFPAGILQPPYFHPLWPASINYGGMGIVAGHELTHGFDDEGVQWGPSGALSFPSPSCTNCTGWMDANSTAGFNSMAQCVISEYDKFCPPNLSQYSPNCVNGVQTQGENIADNGGIHAAFRAYRTHIALDGPDPLLPDRLFGQFTHDQLFFLSFAQVWCEKPRSNDKLYQQLMVDPHSPSMYRVFGTIQNYPAFKVAFNCPANSAYTPSSHCNVWVPNTEP
ncbi:unnamed protein product [Cylicocyclus nassatus]|uniref:Peptidase family M13 n=1 Tax=Cylicocyclus nassatus TaxID=53992 RepID=A0AA36M973_CYLNA|nr:unnamed protein product [Cylicocyclus nassatus]